MTKEAKLYAMRESDNDPFDNDEETEDDDTDFEDALQQTGISIGPKDKAPKDVTIIDEEVERKKAFAKVLEFITNTFYRTDENEEITVEVSSAGKGTSKNKSTNFYDTKRIVLAEGLIDAFGELNLPRFLVYYHELGHHLYSMGLFNLLKVWQTQKQGPLTWDDKYMHLLNWIEDLYIEDRLVKEHSYLTDVISCIKKLPPDYDINKIIYAFNFWYIHQGATPALNYTDQLAFKAYITQLLNIRSNTTIRFGQGILTTVSIKQSTETKYALLIIEFYNWCVSKGIFPKNQKLKPLSNPNNHLEDNQGGQGGQGAQQQGQGQGQGQSGQGDQGDQGGQPGGGSYSDHSGQVTRAGGYTEAYHIKSPTTIFKDELAQENRMINKEMLDMSQRIQAEESSLDGLFSTKHHDSSIIQSKVIVPNFFNPNRLIDQVLFKQKDHAYMNVAIYRDISGSTSGVIHKLMSHVCEQLYKDIPVDITYYLYSSGDVSIVELPYVLWEDSRNVPKTYAANKDFSALTGGTNSSAIADVITQQLSEKWLNIIITDGDLNDLMRRDNIMELLKNVFVIAVNSDVEEGLLGVSINDISDLDKINPVLSGINVGR